MTGITEINCHDCKKPILECPWRARIVRRHLNKIQCLRCAFVGADPIRNVEEVLVLPFKARDFLQAGYPMDQDEVTVETILGSGE